jgi:hypothetical protein
MTSALNLLFIVAIAATAVTLGIRICQRWVVVAFANFLEYVQPEREPEGNGRLIMLALPTSAALLMYSIGASSALTTWLPSYLAIACPFRISWLYWVGGLVMNVIIPIWATKLSVGFGDFEEVNSFIRLETNAHHEKADNALMFAMMSSWIILGTSVVFWIILALLPGARDWLYGWMTPL